MAKLVVNISNPHPVVNPREVLLVRDAGDVIAVHHDERVIVGVAAEENGRTSKIAAFRAHQALFDVLIHERRSTLNDQI